MSEILKLLQLLPSPQSIDYVENKKQFHLFSLLTEQRHPKTWNLSFTVQADAEAGLRMLLSVDQDISRKLAGLIREPAILEQAVEAMVEAVQGARRIYFYGCGATGRLAKQMESTFWRPFWRKIKQHASWLNLRRHLPPNIEDLVVGEMTGADRALVSSLEGFEDLQLIGRLQLENHAMQAGDVVICVTEGGETSSVIGTILAALKQYGDLDPGRLQEARRHLYFIYNNPDDVLRPFERSASVLDNPAISRINLTTGPQAITGSTRMQATTIETFVVGALLEEAIARILRRHLTAFELRELGYSQRLGLTDRLASFEGIKAAVDAAVPSMAAFTRLETDTYRRNRFATYFAQTALITVFIDNTERSPTFRLYPLDRAQDNERRCWVQVWTKAGDFREAWESFLGRPFQGLEDSCYRAPFEREILDPYLREAALRSLAGAGNDQEQVYDFSFSRSNIEHKGPQPGDLGVAVLVDQELAELEQSRSSFREFVDLVHDRGARLALVSVGARNGKGGAGGGGSLLRPGDVPVPIAFDSGEDPLTLRRQIALKMLLNAHSTAVMSSLGRVIGNTMTNVSPSNLKLIGRATYLIMMHVNDTLSREEWVAKHGHAAPIAFAEANAVLFESMDYVRAHPVGQTAEVALSIIRIIEAFCRGGFVGWGEARQILEAEGLAGYLVRHNPALLRPTATEKGEGSEAY
jgi:N-acetylmuramic acid 6-phosphate (MurNAc-6-P) etherase